MGARAWALEKPQASTRDQAEAHWIPVESPGHMTTHPDNTAIVQALRPRCLVHVSGISADCGQRGLGRLFQVQQVPSGNHYEGSGQVCQWEESPISRLHLPAPS